MQPTFLFDDRKRFDAECDHDQLRSSLQTDIPKPGTADPWKLPPVDFTVKNFHPDRKKVRNLSSSLSSSPPLISPREKLLQNPQADNPAVMRPFAPAYQSATRKSFPESSYNEENAFLLCPKIKYDKVKRILNTEPYKNPQLHDFRQYPSIKELGLSEFQTVFAQDPYNIRFLSNNLNILWLQERAHERIPDVQKPLPEMYRTLTARPQWDSRLVLPKLAFPNRYAAYTRYPNPTRSVKTAYWERVENRLDRQKNSRLDVT